MNRQQRRYNDRKAQKKRTATYNLTQTQLDNAVKAVAQKELDAAYQSGMENGVNQALVFLLTLPLEVLMDYY